MINKVTPSFHQRSVNLIFNVKQKQIITVKNIQQNNFGDNSYVVLFQKNNLKHGICHKVSFNI